jgi:hypothetical protein
MGFANFTFYRGTILCSINYALASYNSYVEWHTYSVVYLCEGTYRIAPPVPFMNILYNFYIILFPGRKIPVCNILLLP